VTTILTTSDASLRVKYW